jgi:small subunit ribosomal protein S8
MTNYQVGDFLIRLKNASMAGIKEVVFPKTNLVAAVAKTLKAEGFLDSVTEEDNNLVVTLSIFAKKPVLTNVKIVSKPGLRIYVNVDEIEKMKTPETLIISTPKGVLSGNEAKKKRTGGELIAKVI